MTEEQKQKLKGAVIDRTLHKLVSRKLLVWTAATVGIFFGAVESTDWVDVCMVYIGSQTVVDTVTALRGAKSDG